MGPDEIVDELARSSGRRLVRLAYQLSHDPGVAEDIVQDALLAMLRSWRRTKPEVDHLEAYARRAVVNEYLRRQRRRDASEVVVESPPDRGGGEDGHQHVDDRDAVWSALGALPPRQRAVLVLRYYEDLPDEQIGTLLGVQRATVRSLAARGLEALRTRDLTERELG